MSSSEVLSYYAEQGPITKLGRWAGQIDAGLWFVAGNLIRDLGALNKAELLPWDIWGAQPRPNAELSADELDLFDHVADLTRDPDRTFDGLRETFQSDQRLRAPTDGVYNQITDRVERIV